MAGSKKKEGLEMIAIGITATDTDMGKTMVSGALAAAFNMRGLATGVF